MDSKGTCGPWRGSGHSARGLYATTSGSLNSLQLHRICHSATLTRHAPPDGFPRTGASSIKFWTAALLVWNLGREGIVESGIEESDSHPCRGRSCHHSDVRPYLPTAKGRL